MGGSRASLALVRVDARNQHTNAIALRAGLGLRMVALDALPVLPAVGTTALVSKKDHRGLLAEGQ
jgi:hypothetical protein